MSTPISSVDVYRCNLNPNGLFTCDFAGGQTSSTGNFKAGVARDNYFGSSPNDTFCYKINNSYTGCTFVRKDMTITIGTNAETLNNYGANYCRFRNTSDGRWYYAFITKIEYVAEQTTRLYIKTDLFTTYFDLIVENTCMVEREHVYNDTVFKHTLEEPTPHFEQFMRTLAYKKWDASTGDELDANFRGVAHGTGGSFDNVVNFIGNTYQPGMTFCTTPTWSTMMIKYMVRDQENITWTTYMPKDGVPEGGESGEPNIFWCDGTCPDTQLEIQNPYNSIMLYGDGEDGHTVRNNKLNCFPYSAIEMNDFWSQSVILKPELMKSNNFWISYVLCDAPSITMRYSDYESNNGEDSFKNQISLSDLPEICYGINYYDQYVAIHKNQLAVEQTKDDWRVMKSILNVPKAVTKGATGDISGGVDSVMDGMFSHFEREAMLSDMKQRPPLTYFNATRNERFRTNTFGFRVNHYYPTKEYADMLDDFFDRFGYNVTEVKKPLWNTRGAYNFIKTNGANFGGAIPVEDKAKLNQLFDAGITIWHSTGNYGDYDVNNLAPVR